LIGGRLYDLVADPHEDKDLAQKQPDVVQRLAEMAIASLPTQVSRKDKNLKKG
jgi:hypothetical protein